MQLGGHGIQKDWGPRELGVPGERFLLAGVREQVLVRGVVDWLLRAGCQGQGQGQSSKDYAKTGAGSGPLSGSERKIWHRLGELE
jgi:hypothetical protein